MLQMRSRAAPPNAVRLESPFVEAKALAEQFEIAAEPCRRRFKERLVERPSADKRICELANEPVI
eukprot:2536923-Heterocapsa_arctica.AAC.1